MKIRGIIEYLELDERVMLENKSKWTNKVARSSVGVWLHEDITGELKKINDKDVVFKLERDYQHWKHDEETAI